MKLKSRTANTTSTTGISTTIDLDGTVDGQFTFVDQYSDGDTDIPYVIEDGTAFEYGFGTFNTGSPNTFSRDNIIRSTNADGAISLSGTNSTIFVTALGEDSLHRDDTGRLFDGDNNRVALLVPASTQTGAFTAATDREYPCDTTSASFTASLPISPQTDDRVRLYDPADSWGTNNLTVSGNGNNIEGNTSRTLNRGRGWEEYVYNGAQWLVVLSSQIALPPAGGGTETSTSGDVTLSKGDDRVQSITMTSTVNAVVLPDATTYSVLGGPLFIINNAGSNSFDVEDNGNNTLVTLKPGETADCALAANGTANGVWVIGHSKFRGWELIADLDIENSDETVVTNTSDYEMFMFNLSVDDVDNSEELSCELQVSTDGGSTFDSNSNHYEYTHIRYDGGVSNDGNISARNNVYSSISFNASFIPSERFYLQAYILNLKESNLSTFVTASGMVEKGALIQGKRRTPQSENAFKIIHTGPTSNQIINGRLQVWGLRG